MKIPQIKNAFISALILMMGAIDIGFGMVYPSYTTTAIGDEFGLNDTARIWFNCAGTFSAVFTSIGINFAIVYFGKKKSCFWSALFTTVMWILLGVSVNTGMVFAFRILSCSSIGIFATLIPTYIAEVAPVKFTYLFGFLNQIGIAIGYLIVTILGAYLNWDIVAYICAIPNFILFIFILFVPEKGEIEEEIREKNNNLESSDDSIKNKKDESSTSSSNSSENKNNDQKDPHNDNKDPENSIEMRQEKSGSVFIRTCAMSLKMFIAFMFMFYLQFSGVTSVMTNMQTLLDKANLPISNQIVGILALLVQFIATLIAAGIVDKLGRFLCWTISAIIQLIAFIILFLHQLLDLEGSYFMVGLFLEQFGYGIGNGPIPFAATATLFPPELASTGMAIATAENWLLTGGICLVFPYLEEAITLAYTFLFFAIIMVTELIFGFLVLRKTPKIEATED